MSIVAWSGSKTTTLMQAGKQKVQNALTRKGIRVSKQMQSRETPVQAVQAEMLREPVFQLVFALISGSASAAQMVSRSRQTHAVEALYVFDVLVHEEPHFSRHGGDAPAAGPRDEGHGSIVCEVVLVQCQRGVVGTPSGSGLPGDETLSQTAWHVTHPGRKRFTLSLWEPCPWRGKSLRCTRLQSGFQWCAPRHRLASCPRTPRAPRRAPTHPAGAAFTPGLLRYSC